METVRLLIIHEGGELLPRNISKEVKKTIMRSSCIFHPIRDSQIIIHRWQIEFCQGDHCAAALLSFYEYWHNIKLEIINENIKSNKIAIRHGGTEIHENTLLQFHTYDELVAGILHLYGRNAVISANKLLMKLGVISLSKNPNIKYSLDKNRYIKFHPEICNTWLLEKYNTQSVNLSQEKVEIPAVYQTNSLSAQNSLKVKEVKTFYFVVTKNSHYDNEASAMAS